MHQTQKLAQRLRRLNVQEFLGRDEDDSSVWREQAERLLEEQHVQIEASGGGTIRVSIRQALVAAQREDRHVRRIADDEVERLA